MGRDEGDNGAGSTPRESHFNTPTAALCSRAEALPHSSAPRCACQQDAKKPVGCAQLIGGTGSTRASCRDLSGCCRWAALRGGCITRHRQSSAWGVVVIAAADPTTLRWHNPELWWNCCVWSTERNDSKPPLPLHCTMASISSTTGGRSSSCMRLRMVGAVCGGVHRWLLC